MQLPNFKLIVRTFRKEIQYSLINLSGLAVGITCFILIILYTADELSFDKYHSKAERIYRLNEFYEANDGAGERSSSLPFPVAEVMLNDYPDQIEQYVRVFNFQAPALTVKYEPSDIEFNERNFFFVDSTYAQVFDLALTKGVKETALREVNSVVISETIAAKYFPNEEPIGKLLRFQDKIDLMVTGVMPNAPLNSHFHPAFLASMSTVKSFYGGNYPGNWFWNPCWTYLLLKEGAKPGELEARFPDFVKNHFPVDIREDISMKVQPLVDIHLRSNLEFEMEPNGDESDIQTFIGIAFFVLAIACLNFVNLVTATSVRRSKEVGLKKTLGSSRRQLFFQFMSESVMMSTAGVIVAVILTFLALPLFNEFTSKQLVFEVWRGDILLYLVGIAIALGLVSGFYPAIVISSYRPLSAIKLKDESTGKFFRKTLVAIQFAISFALIIFTLTANKQLKFLQNSDMGFQRTNIIMVPVMRTPIAPHYKSLTDRAKEDHTIQSITALEEVIGSKFQTANYRFEGMDRESLYPRLNVRHDFLETFSIPLLAGRDYSIDQPTDDSLALVVNESLVRGLNWSPQDAVGRSFQFGPYNGKIVGVCKDFNFTSKHSPIGPLVLHLNTRPGGFNLFLKYMAVRIDGNSISGSINRLKDLWDQSIPSKPFEYFFLDNELENLYKAEANLSRVVTAFSSLAILVACLGLFGLASYDTEMRKREISIRKVFGGSFGSIISMVLSGYARLLFLAIVLACPLVYFLLYRWLSGFAYHIDVPVGGFFTAAGIIVGLGITAVGYKSWQAAATNPVTALKE